MENLSGATIKGYELRERIGSGGFGAVYRAYQSSVRREVAIKVILPHFVNHPDFIRRFEAEAELVARLEHPHIIPLHDYWRDASGAYLVMRWLRGGNLGDALKSGPYTPQAALLLLDQVASALALAHRNNVIHRDLKPANVLLDEDGNAYVADFGIAKDLSSTNPGLTGADAVIGSPDYLSPEQARSEPVSPQTDIYSLGVMLYEVLTGQHPFPNLTPVERMFKHLNEPLPTLTNLPAEITSAVNAVIQQATAKNPAHRYQDALSMAAAFRDALGLHTRRNGDSVVEALTQREQEVLQRIIDGQSNKQIAQDLVIAIPTVKWYITQIYSKLGVRSRVQAIVRARELNLIAQAQTGLAAQAIQVPTDQFMPTNPYKGLRAFQAADCQDFFGREAQIDRLIKRLGENHELARFLAVIGPSGSGKSSLVKAGLIPALWRGALPGSERWFIVEMLPGAHPADELEVALTRVAANQSAATLRDHLARDERGLLRVAQLILPNDGSQLVLVVDQFEEVFTLVADEQARVHFLNLIRETVSDPRSRVRVIITLRADFYDRPLLYPEFGELIHSRMETVLPLTAEGLERAIARPAERVGARFEEGLVASIVAEVNYQPGALPLLQYALTELFDRRRGHVLTREAYQDIGGTVGALARRADELYEGLDTAGQEAVHQMFLRLVTLGEGVEDTRRRVPRAELIAIAADEDTMDDVIDSYAEYRLLSLDHDPATRSPTVEVAHEAILREWKRLRGWLNESRHDIRMQRLLANAAGEWLAASRDSSFLLRGSRLEQFQTWASDTKLALTQKEREFLDASIAERERLALAEQKRLAHEQTLERRSRDFLRSLIATLTVFLLVAVGLSIFAFSSRGEALANFKRAEAQRLGVEANRLLLAGGGSELIALLAIRSMNIQYTPQGDEALAAAARLDYPRWIFSGHTLPVGHLMFSPDGRYLLSVGADKTARLWDIQTGREIHQFVGRADSQNPGKAMTNAVFLDPAMTSAAFSPDGHYILTGNDRTARLWDVQTGQELRQFAGHTNVILAVAFTPDGKTMITGGMDKTARLWDVQTGQELRQLVGHTDSVQAAAFAPDGKTVVTGSDDRTARLWDVQTGQELRQFVGHSSAIFSLAFSPDGRYVLTGGQNGEVHLWDARTGQDVRRLNYTAPRVTAVAFSSDGAVMLTAGANDLTARLWNTETGQEIRRFFGPSYVMAAALSPDGRMVAVSSENVIRVWDTQSSPELPQLVGHTDRIQYAIFSPNGEYVLTSSNDYTARLWDARTGREIRRFDHPGLVTGLAFSPDGRTILTGCDDKAAHLWDVQTGQEIRQLRGHTDLVQGVAFSPDGKIALTGSHDQTARLWDVQTGQELHHLTGHSAVIVHAVTFSPDGTTVLTSAFDGTARLWDARTGQQLRVFSFPEGAGGGSAAFSPDGKTMVVGDYYGVLRLWDVQTGQEIRRFFGHSSVVWTVVFSPDGRYILSGSGDNTQRLWDVQTGRELRRFAGQGITGGGAMFSPDGRYVLTAAGSMVARLWDTDYQDTIRYLCTRLQRDLSESERVQYGLLDKEPTCPKTAAPPPALN